MIGFEPRISCVGSDHTANRVTTTAQQKSIIIASLLLNLQTLAFEKQWLWLSWSSGCFQRQRFTV